jgi:hypothetical protein
MPIDIDAILAKAAEAIDSVDNLKQTGQIPKRKPRKKKDELLSGKGYVYAYDENGKSVPKARLEMQRKLKRKLKSWESVKFKDGDRYNFDPDNLELTIKAGVPLTEIPCPHCGDRSLFDCLNALNSLQIELPS